MSLLAPYILHGAGGGGGPALVDNQGDTYYTAGSFGDTQTYYVEATFELQSDSITQVLHETQSRSRVEVQSSGQVFVRVHDGSIYAETTTETITTSDGLVTLIVDVDLSVPTISVTKNGTPMTIAAIALTGSIEHSRPITGFLANSAGANICDLHMQELKVSYDDQSTFIVNLQASDGATSLNANTHDGTATITQAGTGFVDV